MAQQPPVGQGLLIIDASRSHSDTPHSVGLLWTSDRPDAETSTWQHTVLTRDIHAFSGIRTRNPRNLPAADPYLNRAATGIGFTPYCHIKPGEGDHYTVLCYETRHLPLWLTVQYVRCKLYRVARKSLDTTGNFCAILYKNIYVLRCALITR